MPVPKQRHNKARQGRRRAGQRKRVVAKNTQTCPKCGAQKMSHTVCSKCGYYKGREVIDVLKKENKKKA